MTTNFDSRSSSLLKAVVLALLLMVWVRAVAGPGAHGPGGEHLDQAPDGRGKNAAVPRFEASTELFELVAVLGGGELSILIDRFATNEPVLDAQVEVESAGKKALARFHSDHGDYAVDDPALLAVLSQPGEHPVVISVAAKDESDLLNGTLIVAEAISRTAAGAHAHGDADHDHEHELERALFVGSGVVTAALLIVFWWKRRRRQSGVPYREVRP